MAERVSVQFGADKHVNVSFAVGVVCMKLAGLDAGKLRAITEVINHNYVKVGGNIRNRKVNIKHLQSIGKVVDVKKDLKGQF